MVSNRFWMSRFSICAIIFILILADKGFAQSSADDDIHISAIAELYFLQVYQQEKGGHKALAVGHGGYWAAPERRPSLKAAETAAVYDCRKTLLTAPTGLTKRSCVLFDVDGKLTGKATPVGIPFGTLREGRGFR